MTPLDWSVLLITLLVIALYGVWKSRHVSTVDDYLRGGNSLRWPTIGLSIMATQASAITFLSTPGQAFEDGLRFVQFYFGLPLAMIVIAAVFVPIYRQLNIYTAYEYLEHRFDQRVRYLGAVLFLTQRGLAAGITIYAPAIILSSILGWPLQLTIVAIGLLVVIYTVFGGSRAVSHTQQQQMIVMLAGMAVAGVVIAFSLPKEVSLGSALHLAGALDRINPVSFGLSFEDRYNVWSGLSGGFFLALAYFGTDQSQVQRYLAGRSISEIRLGLLFNGMFKIPMQFGILFVGVLVFVFYLFNPSPLFFNAPTWEQLRATPSSVQQTQLEERYQHATELQRQAAVAYAEALERQERLETPRAQLRRAFEQTRQLRSEARELVKSALPAAESKDTDYVFITFVLNHLPAGVIGLLIAAILCAAMSSTSSELAALGSTSLLDLYKRLGSRTKAVSLDSTRDLTLSKWFTALWGLIAIGFASFASLIDNLIQAVNIVGSLFYGTLLGLFVAGFFFKQLTATPVLLAACIAEATVLALYFATGLGFLWFNLIGCVIVVLVASLLQPFVSAPPPRSAAPPPGS
jgi:Na+/proline symporter